MYVFHILIPSDPVLSPFIIYKSISAHLSVYNDLRYGKLILNGLNSAEEAGKCLAFPIWKSNFTGKIPSSLGSFRSPVISKDSSQNLWKGMARRRESLTSSCVVAVNILFFFRMYLPKS